MTESQYEWLIREKEKAWESLMKNKEKKELIISNFFRGEYHAYSKTLIMLSALEMPLKEWNKCQ